MLITTHWLHFCYQQRVADVKWPENIVKTVRPVCTEMERPSDWILKSILLYLLLSRKLSGARPSTPLPAMFGAGKIFLNYTYNKMNEHGVAPHPFIGSCKNGIGNKEINSKIEVKCRLRTPSPRTRILKVALFFCFCFLFVKFKNDATCLVRISKHNLPISMYL